MVLSQTNIGSNVGSSTPITTGYGTKEQSGTSIVKRTTGRTEYYSKGQLIKIVEPSGTIITPTTAETRSAKVHVTGTSGDRTSSTGMAQQTAQNQSTATSDVVKPSFEALAKGTTLMTPAYPTLQKIPGGYVDIARQQSVYASSIKPSELEYAESSRQALNIGKKESPSFEALVTGASVTTPAKKTIINIGSGGYEDIQKQISVQVKGLTQEQVFKMEQERLVPKILESKRQLKERELFIGTLRASDKKVGLGLSESFKSGFSFEEESLYSSKNVFKKGLQSSAYAGGLVAGIVTLSPMAYEYVGAKVGFTFGKYTETSVATERLFKFLESPIPKAGLKIGEGIFYGSIIASGVKASKEDSDVFAREGFKIVREVVPFVSIPKGISGGFRESKIKFPETTPISLAVKDVKANIGEFIPSGKRAEYRSPYSIEELLSSSAKRKEVRRGAIQEIYRERIKELEFKAEYEESLRKSEEIIKEEKLKAKEESKKRALIDISSAKKRYDFSNIAGKTDFSKELSSFKIPKEFESKFGLGGKGRFGGVEFGKSKFEVKKKLPISDEELKAKLDKSSEGDIIIIGGKKYKVIESEKIVEVGSGSQKQLILQKQKLLIEIKSKQEVKQELLSKQEVKQELLSKQDLKLKQISKQDTIQLSKNVKVFAKPVFNKKVNIKKEFIYNKVSSFKKEDKIFPKINFNIISGNKEKIPSSYSESISSIIPKKDVRDIFKDKEIEKPKDFFSKERFIRIEKPKLPELIIPKIKLPSLSSRKSGEYFIVEVGRKGKTKVYEKKAFGSLFEAEKYLGGKLKGTIAASGRITTALGKSVDINLGEQFTPSKSEAGRIVQKAKYRLSSVGEKQQIREFRI